MLELPLVPGKGLGDFTLGIIWCCDYCNGYLTLVYCLCALILSGMPISDAVSVIQQNIDVISHVELKFNESVCAWVLELHSLMD